MSLLTGLPKSKSKSAVYIRGQAVGDSKDLRRVLALPRRPRPDAAQLALWAEYIKQELGTGITSCECESRFKRRCCANLLPVQAWALYEAATVGGLLGPIGVGHGKAIALDTPIPTPTGWTTMGELSVGDLVFDSKGQPCRVLHATEVQHNRECFDVRFSDGSIIVADADHRWLTRSYLERRSLDRGTVGVGSRPSRPHEPQVRTTLEIRDTLYHRHNRNHAVDVAGALVTEDACLPLDPYLLGMWLGDGSTTAGEITSADPEVLGYFDAVFERGHSSMSGRASSQYYKGLQTVLRKMGVLGNKHVPAAYLRASQGQRLALLQGLMDSDGHGAADSTVEFCNTNPVLASAVFELAASLGQIPKTYGGLATLYGKDCGPKFRVCWQPTINVFRLSRKSALLRLGDYKQSQIKSRRYIESVTPRQSVPVRCITVDSPDHSYLCGKAMITTHNTLLDLLTPMVVENCKTAVLLLPPNLKAQMLEVDWYFYGQHWKLPNLAGGRWLVSGRPTLHVVAFSELSGSRATDLLERLRPDVVVVDEAHSVRNRTAARTRRFRRYIEKHKPRLFAWSGTLTSRSLKDYADLSNFALGEGSPTPLHFPTVEEWAGHLDPSDFRSPPGRLLQFGDDARVGYAKWLVDTVGVVSSGDTASCQASLIIAERPLETPSIVQEHIDALEASWTRPDGEELVDAMSVGRCARELSCGFYYRWRFPRKEPREVIDRWFNARKEWNKELRERLKLSRPHMDSPLLCAKAAIRWYKGYTHVERDESGAELQRVHVPPRSTQGPLPVWPSLCWPEWEEVRNTVHHETEPVWLSDFLVEDCLAWLAEGPGILWYEFDGLARRLGQYARERGLAAVLAGPGSDGNDRVIRLVGNEPVIASIRAHGTGKNLQQFSRNLVANPPSSGSEWEQLIGRTFRQGQGEDEVNFQVYRHTDPVRRAVEKARDLSEYIEETFGALQSLASKATWLF
jgi:hypothetical protein